MNKLSFAFALAGLLGANPGATAKAKPNRSVASKSVLPRSPLGLTNKHSRGTYVGEALYEVGGVKPAVRLYLHALGTPEGRFSGEYNAILLEYGNALGLAAPYLTAQLADKKFDGDIAKQEGLKNKVGYLPDIAKRMWAYRVRPVKKNVYDFFPLKVVNGKIEPDSQASRRLHLNPHATLEAPLADAELRGAKREASTRDKDGDAVSDIIRFPGKIEPQMDGHIAQIRANLKEKRQNILEKLSVTQMDLIKLTYKVAHLNSSWRGSRNWTINQENYSFSEGDDWVNGDLIGSYHSLYAFDRDPVLELSVGEDNAAIATFRKSILKPSDEPKLLNPDMYDIVGTYRMEESTPDLFTLIPMKEGQSGDAKMTGRIGAFTDVFDAQNDAAGNHLVVEIVFMDPENPASNYMYYEDIDHKKNMPQNHGK